MKDNSTSPFFTTLMRELDSQLRLAKLSCSYSSLLSTPTSPNLSVSLQQLKYQARALYKEVGAALCSTAVVRGATCHFASLLLHS